MTPATLTRLHALGISITDFVTRTGVHESTVRGWGKVRNKRLQPEPRWVPLAIDGIEAKTERKTAA